jgi:hypothetical protein
MRNLLISSFFLQIFINRAPSLKKYEMFGFILYVIDFEQCFALVFNDSLCPLGFFDEQGKSDFEYSFGNLHSLLDHQAHTVNSAD